jgi:hypothetical protein
MIILECTIHCRGHGGRGAVDTVVPSNDRCTRDVRLIGSGRQSLQCCDLIQNKEEQVCDSSMLNRKLLIWLGVIAPELQSNL